MWQQVITSIVALLLIALPANAQIFGGGQSYGGGGSTAATPATVTIEVVTGQLSSAQIKALKATPITLLSAAGTGKILTPIRANATYNRVTASYTGGSTGIDFEYNGQASSTPLEIAAQTAITAAANRYMFKSYEAGGGLPSGNIVDSNFDCRNVAVRAINAAASEYASGSGNISYDILYAAGITVP